MKSFDRERFRKLSRLLATGAPEPAQQAERIVSMQRDIVMPSKLGVLLVVLYYFQRVGWAYEIPTTWSVVQEVLQNYFAVYLLCNILGAVVFYNWRRLPPEMFQWMAFTMGLLDGLFLTGLVIVTGGFDSIVFWLFPAMILLNALSIPLAVPQMVLNVIVSLFYLAAVVASPNLGQYDTAIVIAPTRGAMISRTVVTNLAEDAVVKSSRQQGPIWRETRMDSGSEGDVPVELLSLRVALLWLLTLCCYGAQVLLERQRQAVVEAQEFAARENQLHSAGRLAAEFAHQIKNPLAVINNTLYSLRRGLRDGKSDAIRQQLEIIQEEVGRADRVITQIMGYAQLSEGRVEKLEVVAEINRAVEQVFPPAASPGISVKAELASHFPPLLMQRGHLSEIFVNLLQNAREAIRGKGVVRITARCKKDNAIEITVADNGPGIAPDKLEQIFEAYFTTKEKGSGLGLAIVRHNIELYGGAVRVESELGKGARFILTFPAKTIPKPFAK